MDSEFENVSCQLLKRTRAMLDKYRHLLFEESKVVVFIQFGFASRSPLLYTQDFSTNVHFMLPTSAAIGSLGRDGHD